MRYQLKYEKQARESNPGLRMESTEILLLAHVSLMLRLNIFASIHAWKVDVVSKLDI